MWAVDVLDETHYISCNGVFRYWKYVLICVILNMNYMIINLRISIVSSGLENVWANDLVIKTILDGTFLSLQLTFFSRWLRNERTDNRCDLSCLFWDKGYPLWAPLSPICLNLEPKGKDTILIPRIVLVCFFVCCLYAYVSMCDLNCMSLAYLP